MSISVSRCVGELAGELPKGVADADVTGMGVTSSSASMTLLLVSVRGADAIAIVILHVVLLLEFCDGSVFASSSALTSGSGIAIISPTGTDTGTACVKTGELGASGIKGSFWFTRCAGELGRLGPTPTGEQLRVACAEPGRGCGRGK